jgi:hypothetical protein
MWLWPITRFWTFTPLGWFLAVLWNLSEIFKTPLPFAGYIFGIIIGCKDEQVKGDK